MAPRDRVEREPVIADAKYRVDVLAMAEYTDLNLKDEETSSRFVAGIVLLYPLPYTS